jgi:hypothetical protein
MHYLVAVITPEGLEPDDACAAADELLWPYSEEFPTEVNDEPYYYWEFDPAQEDRFVKWAADHCVNLCTPQEIVKYYNEHAGFGKEILFIKNGAIFQKLTENPNTKWDWFLIGGRWSGIYGDDVTTVADVLKALDSGVRPENVGKEISDLLGPLALVGVGDSVADFGGSRRPTATAEASMQMPFAIVTPGGEWFERGKKDSEEWAQEARVILETYRGHPLIVVDIHAGWCRAIPPPAPDSPAAFARGYDESTPVESFEMADDDEWIP